MLSSALGRIPLIPWEDADPRKVADVRRCRSRHAFGSGNRTPNRVLYTMAITQIRADTEGRAYYLRKGAEGKTSREALRCLKRRLS